MDTVAIPAGWEFPKGLADATVLDMLYDARQGLLADGDTDILDDNARAIERELGRISAGWRDPHCPMGHSDGTPRRGNGGGEMGGGRGAQIYASDKAREHATRIWHRLGVELNLPAKELASKVSKLIDDGMAKLKEEGIALYPASPAQQDKIRQLFHRKFSDETAAQMIASLDFDRFDGREASKTIDKLLAMPDFVEVRQTEPTKPGQKIPGHGPGREHEPKAQVTDGMYQTPDGDIVKVQKAIHGSGQLYAKKLVKLDEPKLTAKGEKTHEFVYTPGLIRQLKAEWKMSLEEAQAWGKLYGTCCRCGITLTKEESQDRGMGDWCYAKGRREMA